MKDLFWELFEAEYTYLFRKLFLFYKKIQFVTKKVGDFEQ